MSNFESQLPTGNYEGEVISQELAISTGGHAEFVIKFGSLVHTTSGPVNPETRRIVRLYMSKASADFTLKKLATAGFIGSVDQFVLDSPDAISIIGNKVALYMKEGTHGGATTEDWDISSGNSSSSTSVDAMTAKELAAKWSHKMVKGVPTPSPTAFTATPPERESTF
jgi:hypothetical protein